MYDQTAAGNPPDALALAVLRSGDEQRIAALVSAWSPGMLRVARNQGVSAASAEDVVQEAWVTALRGLAQFQGRSTLRTWVFGIVVNIARRTGAKERRTLSTSSWPDRAARVDQQPENIVAARELRDVVDDVLAQMPARQQAVVTVRDIIGLDAVEVSALLGLSPANQRVLLHRGRMRIRDAVAAYSTDAPRPVTSHRLRRHRRPRPGRPISCRHLVMVVDDYLDGDLDPALRTRVEEHLESCPPCERYVGQVQRLLDLTRLIARPAPPELVARLTHALRAHHDRPLERVSPGA